MIEVEKRVEIIEKIMKYLEEGEGFSNKKIRDLGLLVGTYTPLKRARIECLEDVNGKMVDDLKKIRNFGIKAQNDFLETAEKFGYFVEDGKIVRKFELEEQSSDIDEILIEDMNLSTQTKRSLNRNGIKTMSDIIENIQITGGRKPFSDEIIKNLEKEMAKHGYSLNRTGFFTRTEKMTRKPNILLEQFRINGLRTLEFIDFHYFAKDSHSMYKINKAFETYLNAIVKEKVAEKDVNFDQIEKEVNELRNSYKCYVDKQRQKLRAEKNKADFISKMTAKNSEIVRYHHNPNKNNEKRHSYNPFVDEREL